MEDFDFDLLQLETEEKMSDSMEQYLINMSKISAGRANPQILNSVVVDYFETMTPIHQLANISVPEPRQLIIKPYDMSITKQIVGAINSASLGVNAVDEGDKARITFPEMTTERRKELVKSLGQYTEQAKVKIRNARQEANKIIKASKQSEDTEKDMHDEIQTLTNKYVQKVDDETKVKSTELLSI